MAKRRKKKKLREKVGVKRFGTDSMWSRSSAQRAGTEKGRKSIGGKEIQQILGIEDTEGPSSIKSDPLSMMDIILAVWQGTDKELPNRVFGHGKKDPKGPPEDSLNNDDEEEEYD